MFRIKSSPDQQAPAILQPHFDPRVTHYVGRGLRHLHFHESRRRVLQQPFLPPVEMRRAQLLLSAERRYTLPAPLLFGNQPAPLRPCCSASFSSPHRATLLCDVHSPQDALHVALTEKLQEMAQIPLLISVLIICVSVHLLINVDRDEILESSNTHARYL
jgi:hypothetical protein